MKKLTLLSPAIILFAFFNTLQAEPIKALFFDIETIFQTDSMRASGYIGKIDSLRYLSTVGHLPCQEDLFKQLKPVKAHCTQITYNKNLAMPLIFSDWLANIQPATKIKDIIQRYFSHQNISEIEKKVLYAVVSMMLTPQHLADTQKINSKMIALLEKLKSYGYKIFLVGNWTHIASLKNEFNDVFKLFSGIYVSGDLHLLKPSQEYYQTVLNRSGFTNNQALWIETESKFISRAKEYGYQIAAYNPDHTETLIQTLRSFGIKV